MSALRSIDPIDPTGDTHECRVAARARVFMRATVRVCKLPSEYGLSIKDISSTGLKASAEISLLPGTQVEINLRNIGWVQGQVVWDDRNGMVGIRFAKVIQPELTRNQVSGSYPPVGIAPVLRRL